MATAPKAAGIMDLPENAEMDQAPQLSPMESYDSVTTALNIASPDAAAQYEQTMNMSLPPELMDMSAEEIGQLLQLFQFLQDNPEEYPAAIAELVKDGIIDEGDLPPEYDDEVLATVSALLMQALKTKQGAMPQQPQGFAMGGIADAARIVANQGRGQDTMLAHITPDEAQLLRSRGGMGTINPMTGLREFGLFKKIFRGATKVVKAVVKPIVSVAKKIVASPIGRIVATVALTAFLGPAGAAMGGGFFGAAAAAGIAGTSIGLLSGESLKDSLISGAVSYFGAPGGAVSNFVGQAGITSIAGQAAAASGLIGTAAGLARGKSLKDSIKGGLTQAAIGGGTAIVSNYMAQAGGSKSLMDAINKDAPVLTPAGVFEDPSLGKLPALKEEDYKNLDPDYYNQVNGLTPARPAPAPIIDGSAQVPMVMDPSLTNAMARANAAGNNAPIVSGSNFPQQQFGIGSMAAGNNAPVVNASGFPQQPGVGAMAAGNNAPVVNASGFPQQPGVGGVPAPTGGIGSLVQGGKDLYQGAKDIYGDYFSPSRGAGEGQAAFDSTYDKAFATGRGADYALEMARGAQKAATPGIISQYAPLAAAGLGATALMGGFKQPEMPESELQKRLSGTPGLDLINADPSKYLIGNLPGVEYDERGNITGSKPYSPGQTLDDIRVPAAGTGSGQNLINAYAPPPFSPTAGGGRSIFQPYNTSNGYPNLMGTPTQPRYAAQGGMMSGGIANLAQGGYPRRNGQIDGPGTEKSDSIPAMLSDGEFVMTASAVRGAGNGSRRAGAKKMYALMHQLEQNSARG
jgi:hypothetical protein